MCEIDDHRICPRRSSVMERCRPLLIRGVLSALNTLICLENCSGEGDAGLMHWFDKACLKAIWPGLKGPIKGKIIKHHQIWTGGEIGGNINAPDWLIPYSGDIIGRRLPPLQRGQDNQHLSWVGQNTCPLEVFPPDHASLYTNYGNHTSFITGS